MELKETGGGHDSRFLSTTIDADIINRPEVTEENPQNLCLDKGYDYKRVEKDLEQYFFTPHNAQNYLAMLHFACALIIFRKLETP